MDLRSKKLSIQMIRFRLVAKYSYLCSYSTPALLDFVVVEFGVVLWRCGVRPCALYVLAAQIVNWKMKKKKKQDGNDTPFHFFLLSFLPLMTKVD